MKKARTPCKIQDILLFFLLTGTIFHCVIGKRGGPWPNGPPPYIRHWKEGEYDFAPFPVKSLSWSW